MTPFSSRHSKSTGRLILLLTLSAGCSGDDVVGPTPPPAGPLATTGRIAVSVFSDRSELEFTLTIDGAGTWTLRPNDDFEVDGLAPGRYPISLRLPATPGQAAQSCRVNEGSQRIAVVRAGETTAVRYQISCGSTPDRPRDRQMS